MVYENGSHCVVHRLQYRDAAPRSGACNCLIRLTFTAIPFVHYQQATLYLLLFRCLLNSINTAMKLIFTDKCSTISQNRAKLKMDSKSGFRLAYFCARLRSNTTVSAYQLTLVLQTGLKNRTRRYYRSKLGISPMNDSPTTDDGNEVSLAAHTLTRT